MLENRNKSFQRDFVFAWNLPFELKKVKLVKFYYIYFINWNLCNHLIFIKENKKCVTINAWNKSKWLNHNYTNFFRQVGLCRINIFLFSFPTFCKFSFLKKNLLLYKEEEVSSIPHICIYWKQGIVWCWRIWGWHTMASESQAPFMRETDTQRRSASS